MIDNDGGQESNNSNDSGGESEHEPQMAVQTKVTPIDTLTTTTSTRTLPTHSHAHPHDNLTNQYSHIPSLTSNTTPPMSPTSSMVSLTTNTGLDAHELSHITIVHSSPLPSPHSLHSNGHTHTHNGSGDSSNGSGAPTNVVDNEAPIAVTVALAAIRGVADAVNQAATATLTTLTIIAPGNVLVPRTISSTGSSAPFRQMNMSINGNNNDSKNNNKQNGTASGSHQHMAVSKPSKSTTLPNVRSLLMPTNLADGWSHIFTFLTATELASCGRVCRDWKIIAVAPHLWRPGCSRAIDRAKYEAISKRKQQAADEKAATARMAAYQACNVYIWHSPMCECANFFMLFMALLLLSFRLQGDEALMVRWWLILTLFMVPFGLWAVRGFAASLWFPDVEGRGSWAVFRERAGDFYYQLVESSNSRVSFDGRLIRRQFRHTASICTLFALIPFLTLLVVEGEQIPAWTVSITACTVLFAIIVSAMSECGTRPWTGQQSIWKERSSYGQLIPLYVSPAQSMPLYGRVPNVALCDHFCE
jgi:hypothetical protein